MGKPEKNCPATGKPCENTFPLNNLKDKPEPITNLAILRLFDLTPEITTTCEECDARVVRVISIADTQPTQA